RDGERRRDRHARSDQMRRTWFGVVLATSRAGSAAWRRAGTLACAAFALAAGADGCGGGGAHASVPPASHQRGAAAAAVRFTMHWPSRAVRSRRRAAYVSPSTMSAIVLVNPDAATPGPVTFANAPGAAGGTTTISIEAPVGNDVFAIALYDAPQTTGETTAQGNLLGSVQTAQTIVADALNTLNATVIGTVASVRLGPVPSQGNVLASSFSGVQGYELVGRDPATFVAAALDADGNVIVQPDAPPEIVVAPSPRFSGILTVTPISGAANEVSVQAVAPNTTTYPSALDATATDANGDVAVSTTIVDETSALYVAYANGSRPAVERYDVHGTVLPLPAGAFAGLQNPVALAYDADDRRIFVADAGLGKVLAFDENGTPASGFAPPAVAGADGVTYDANLKNVYASGASGVRAFAASGGAPAAFAVANAAGIAFAAMDPYGPLNELAIAQNGATPAIAFTDESGTRGGAGALSASPIAVAFGAPLDASTQPIQSNAQLY